MPAANNKEKSVSTGLVLVVEDDQSLREALCDTLEMAGYQTLSAADGREAIEVIGKQQVNMVVSDIQMKPMDGATLLKRIKKLDPGLPVVLMTAYGTIQKAVQAMREGAIDYLVKPFEAEVLVNMVSRLLVEGALHGDIDLVAEDPSSKELLALVRRVACSEATVLLSAESGCGKEVYSRYIHQYSDRNKGPFVAINCAAIPENMLEAVLFGYEKGAFTGAYQSNPGKFEQANGGTILLDEISEMDLGLQAKLLRVLQEKEVERLGSRKVTELDVRVIATTNRDLREEVNAGRFREDLYYRLNVFPLSISPLRQRKLDILPLAKRILAKECKPGLPIPELSKDAEQRLLEHSWPGNVRELCNVIQRSLILKTGDLISDENMYFEVAAIPPRERPNIYGNASDSIQDYLISDGKQDNNKLIKSAGLGSSSTTYDNEEARQSSVGSVCEEAGGDLKSNEQRMILEVLRDERGSRKRTAERLGISPRTLRYKLARMRDSGIQLPN
ncbi:Flagellar two-component response regulator FleR [hydrothermal vent metagenome]|uniref:Flagellar two-component response regulator FleR n=1 Tax=hydrothermal vent metagenome TaxID=652676 RepID=A0A3B0Y960_9ZZZZ